MSNKKYVIAVGVVLVALIVTGVVVGNRETAESPSVDQAKIQETIKAMYAARLGEATILMPDTKAPVTLADGVASFPAAPGSASMVSVVFESKSDIEVVEAPNGRVDVLAIYTLSYGGSGSYRYLALFSDTGETLEMKSIALLGDRVAVTGISTQELEGVGGEEYLVTVDYLAHASGQPMAEAPTVATKKLFVVENGAFNLAKTDSALIEGGKE